MFAHNNNPRPHPEEAAQRPSPRMAARSVHAAILRDAVLRTAPQDEVRAREADVSITANERADASISLTTGLSATQRKNLALASLGSLLEFYEFMVFGFLTVTIARQFFPPSL